jgi:hypothetical protein
MRHRGWLAAAPGIALLALAGCSSTPVPSASSGRACLARLNAETVSYRTVDSPEALDSRCHVDTAVQVSRIDAALSRPVTMSCAMASRLDEFEREAAQPLARAELGRRIAQIDHLGSYSCRRNTGRPSRLSEHALGRAIDIAGFRLSDGSRVSVERDWSDPGAKGVFLHRLAAKACRYFSVVLTPASNADHYNHLHFDIGPERFCGA